MKKESKRGGKEERSKKIQEKEKSIYGDIAKFKDYLAAEDKQQLEKKLKEDKKKKIREQKNEIMKRAQEAKLKEQAAIAAIGQEEVKEVKE